MIYARLFSFVIMWQKKCLAQLFQCMCLCHCQSSGEIRVVIPLVQQLEFCHQWFYTINAFTWYSPFVCLWHNVVCLMTLYDRAISLLFLVATWLFRSWVRQNGLPLHKTNHSYWKGVTHSKSLFTHHFHAISNELALFIPLNESSEVFAREKHQNSE